MPLEKNSKRIETKDWIYLFIISILLQFIFYYFSFIYGGSVKALGYISFAGTLISILLAIIAIGYTYGESIKQKGFSDQLLIEISGLRDIKDKLAGQVNILENIADLKTAIEDTRNAVNNIDFTKELSSIEEQFTNVDVSIGTEKVEIVDLNGIIEKFAVITDHRFFEIIEAIESGQVNDFDSFFKYFYDEGLEKDVRSTLVIMYLSHFSIGKALGMFGEWHINQDLLTIYRKKYPINSNKFSPEDSFSKIYKRVLYSK